MRVAVVSDVHGAAEPLARAKGDADALICLGDLIHFVDYRDHSGMMADLFGSDAVAELVALRTDRRFDDARALSRRLWESLGEERDVVVERSVRRQYERIFAAFPDETYLTYGNVDLPHLYADYLREGVRLLDGEVVELGGLRVGFVGGGLRTPYRTPTEIDDDTYAAKVAALGEVDVLCAHLPPHWPWLVYDVEARRFERGSEALLDAIQTTQPAWCLFGHVHQPLVPRLRIGRTECVNVGHFRATGEPFVLEW